MIIVWGYKPISDNDMYFHNPSLHGYLFTIGIMYCITPMLIAYCGWEESSLPFYSVLMPILIAILPYVL